MSWQGPAEASVSWTEPAEASVSWQGPAEASVMIEQADDSRPSLAGNQNQPPPHLGFFGWIILSRLASRGCTEEPGNTGRGDTELLLNTLLRNTEITETGTHTQDAQTLTIIHRKHGAEQTI